MKEMMTGLLMDESGQGMAEYGLILALVAVVVVGALTLLGQGLDGIFDKVTEDVNSTSGS
ncbi:MAG: Flp family type IVb pilin [Bacillota bacterium]